MVGQYNKYQKVYDYAKTFLYALKYRTINEMDALERKSQPNWFDSICIKLYNEELQIIKQLIEFCDKCEKMANGEIRGNLWEFVQGSRMYTFHQLVRAGDDLWNQAFHWASLVKLYSFQYYEPDGNQRLIYGPWADIPNAEGAD
jgi:hypothetical protein